MDSVAGEGIRLRHLRLNSGSCLAQVIRNMDFRQVPLLPRPHPLVPRPRPVYLHQAPGPTSAARHAVLWYQAEFL
jgi:hypothetical protein